MQPRENENECQKQQQCCVHDGSDYDDELIIKRYSCIFVSTNVPEPTIWRRTRKLPDVTTSCSPREVKANSVHDIISDDSAAQPDIANTYLTTSPIPSEESKLNQRNRSLSLHFGQKVAIDRIAQAPINLNANSLVFDHLPPTRPLTGPLESSPVAAMDDWWRAYLALTE